LTSSISDSCWPFSAFLVVSWNFWAGYESEAPTMTLYVIGGLMALALLIYLVVALLKPELFS